jgi:hypothetical protein
MLAPHFDEVKTPQGSKIATALVEESMLAAGMDELHETAPIPLRRDRGSYVTCAVQVWAHVRGWTSPLTGRPFSV